jgi:hypothetical protein
MEVHHYDYYAVANAPHWAAASERAERAEPFGSRRGPAALNAVSFAKLTTALQCRNEAAA